jgi:PIN domain nuclease of toxin-antitoxin system
VKLLLDTHVVLWWQAGGTRLSRAAARAITTAEEILISPLTCWEVATLARMGRIELDRDAVAWARALLSLDRVTTATLSPEASAWAGGLGDSCPGDPIERLLYATARDHRVPLISTDERLRAFAGTAHEVQVIW